MNLIGVPVPPGFTITTEVCNEYFEKGKDDAGCPAERRREIHQGVGNFDEVEIRRCGKTRCSFPYVRARASMPGMMDTIPNLD